MKLLRVGQRGNEKPAALDAEGKIRDLSTHIKDLNPEHLNFEIISGIILLKFSSSFNVGKIIEIPMLDITLMLMIKH